MAGTTRRSTVQPNDLPRFSASLDDRIRSSARRRILLLLLFGFFLVTALFGGLKLPVLLIPLLAAWLVAAVVVERRFAGMREHAALMREQTVALAADVALVTVVCLGLPSALWLGPMAYAFTLLGAGATLPARRAIPLGFFAAGAYLILVVVETASSGATWTFPEGHGEVFGSHPLLVSIAGITMLLLLVHLQRGLIGAVRRGEERLAQLLTSASDMIFTVDRGGFVVEANDAAAAALGVEHESLPGRRFAHLLHPEDTDRFADAHRAAMQGKAFRSDLRVLSRDGALVQLACAGSAILEHDEISGMLVVARDVSERVASERRMAAQQAVSRALSASASVEECWLELIGELASALAFDVGVLWRYDAATGLLHRDRQWVLYGDDPASGTSTSGGSRSPRDTLAPGEGVPGRAFALGRAEVADGPSSCVFAFPIRFRESTFAVIELGSTRPGIHTGDLPPLGELLGRQLGDALERERLNGELLHAEKVRAIGQLVSGVAHELNNPLTAILGFSEQLQDGDRSEEDREALGMILQQSRRARSIVRDLLTYVRKEERGARKRLEVAPFLEQSARTLSRLAAEYDCALELVLEEDLPAVSAYPAGLEQVLTNLVLNAVQASGSGGRVTLRARSSCARRDGRSAAACELIVEDSGPGIAAHHFPRLFEPFFTTKGTGEGTGLGLPVSLGIVQRHGGTLVVENRPETEGGGARFTITLPATAATNGSAGSGISPAREERSGDVAVEPSPAAAASSAVAVTGEAATSATAESVAAARAVLVIDDEDVIRSALRRFLERRGWRVTEAADGAVALEILEGVADDAFDAVICDLRMPALDGMALHDRLLETRPKLLERFIFSTGDVVSPAAAGFVRATRCPVVEKPFELTALSSVLEGVARPGAERALAG